MQPLFPKLKFALKGTRFESVVTVKEKEAHILKELTEEDFQRCFEQQRIYLECYRHWGGGDTER